MRTVRKLSRYRVATGNVLRVARRHCFPVFMDLEVDATRMLTLAQLIDTNLSAILIKAISNVFRDHDRYQVLNSVLQRNIWGERLVVFDTPSFSVAYSKRHQGEMVAAIYVLEDTLGKGVASIDSELKTMAAASVTDFPLYRKFRFFVYLPSFVQSLILHLWGLIPGRGSVTPGSIGFSNLGKTAVRHFFPLSPKTLMFGVGGVNLRGDIPMLTLGLSFNHFVVDGRIVADFLDLLKAGLESLEPADLET